MITTLIILSLLLLTACTPNSSEIVIPQLSIALTDGGELDGRAVNVAESDGEIEFNVESNSKWIAKSNTEW
ncbi:MAG: hypothetical protein IIW87_09595, partial [Alistipes sp.]|nr:hypothetical protein [Alistipes sp.]